MTTTPETPPEDNSAHKWLEDFQRIVEENELIDVDASELDAKTPSPDFIADYEFLIAKLFALRKKPQTKQIRSVMIASNESVRTFKLFAADILAQNRDNPDTEHILVKLLIATNDIRTDFLSSITNQQFGVFDKTLISSMEEDFPQMAEDGIDLVDVAASIYAEHLTSDIEKLHSLATLEYADKTSTKTLEAVGVLGHHALDLAKIAAGVTVGIIVADKIIRK